MTSTAVPGTPTSTKKGQGGRAALSGWLGSTLEYYDFSIYASAAALVFPTVFFPSEDPAIAIIASLATYGVGYVARPLGAFVLGHFGDRHGRKKLLVFAMLLMGITTFLVGCLPSYSQVGLLAPAMLVVLRLIQGFAVSGELGGATTMIAEHADKNKRGLLMSFALQGTQFGSILAQASFIPLSHFLSHEDLIAWGWRVPFFLSAVVVIVALVIRAKLDETPVFTDKTAVKGRMPIVELFRTSGGALFRAVLMGMANVIGTTVVVFGTTYATQEAYGVQMDADVYLWIPVVANIAAIILIPVFGLLSDKIGRRPFLIFGPLVGGIVAVPYLFVVQAHNIGLTVVLAILSFGIMYQMFNATYASFFQEMFPTETRVTGFALSQNIALFITGLMPSLFAVIAPPSSGHVPLIIGLVTCVLCVASSAAAFFSKETANKDIA